MLAELLHERLTPYLRRQEMQLWRRSSRSRCKTSSGYAKDDKMFLAMVTVGAALAGDIDSHKADPVAPEEAIVAVTRILYAEFAQGSKRGSRGCEALG